MQVIVGGPSGAVDGRPGDAGRDADPQQRRLGPARARTRLDQTQPK